MKLTEQEIRIYNLREEGLTYKAIAEKVNCSISAVRTSYQNVSWIRSKEQEYEIARLEISCKTFTRLWTTNRTESYNLRKSNMDIMSIKGLVDAINNDRIKPFNKRVYRNTITDTMVDEIIVALELLGYKMNHEYSRMKNNDDIAISVKSVYSDNSKRITEFDIMDFSGAMVCSSDGSDARVYFTRATKYKHETIIEKILNILKETGHIQIDDEILDEVSKEEN